MIEAFSILGTLIQVVLFTFINIFITGFICNRFKLFILLQLSIFIATPIFYYCLTVLIRIICKILYIA